MKVGLKDVFIFIFYNLESDAGTALLPERSLYCLTEIPNNSFFMKSQKALKGNKTKNKN